MDAGDAHVFKGWFGAGGLSQDLFEGSTAHAGMRCRDRGLCAQRLLLRRHCFEQMRYRRVGAQPNAVVMMRGVLQIRPV